MSNTCIIASYRYGHLAAHCIETVLEQTVPFDRILFVDDGVGDCAHLVERYPQIEFVLRDENLGIARNFQDMLLRSETERTMFLGADNWLRPDALQILSESEADIVTYDIMVVGNQKDEIVERHPDQIYLDQGAWYWDRSSGHHGSMLYDTRLAQTCGYSSPPGRSLEDKMLFDKMVENGASREHVAEGLLYYRRHACNFNPC